MIGVDRLRNDEGFTLVELVIVLGLLLFVISAAWNVYSLAARGSDVSNRQAFEARELGAPLDAFERILSQCQDFVTTVPGSTPYRVHVRADMDDDQVSEDYIIEATAAGDLVMQSREGTGVYRTGIWSDHNVNVQRGAPLFRYFDSSGDEITGVNLNENVWTYAYSIEITIVAEHGDEPVRSTRRVLLRNR